MPAPSGCPDPVLFTASAEPAELLGRSCRLLLDRPRIMGILNVTPDSFSDGGRFLSAADAVENALRLISSGADIVDIGGESTRPGAPPVSLPEELDRVMPVIERLVKETERPLSIDTSKSKVAAAAVAAGAEFVNDISGLRFDPEMAETVAASGAGLFVMHTRGRPAQMQLDTSYASLVDEVVAALDDSVDRAQRAGIPAAKIAVDPGIGFGKDAAGNLELLRCLSILRKLGRPILLGTSRKSFIGKVLGQADPEQRLAGALATVALGVAAGATILRVHDVAASRDAAMMAWAVCQGEKWSAH